jgi:hypothetical protein
MTEPTDEMVSVGIAATGAVDNQWNRRGMRAALTAALAVAPKPRVKALEWQPYPGKMGESGARFIAYTPIGSQYIVTMLGLRGERWLTSIGSSHDDLAKAKAAAQADFERRIISALEDQS